MKSDTSLTVVGAGIQFLSHLTTEANTYIKQSELVLYLVNDPLMKEWIKQNSIESESLDDLYLKYQFRYDCYQEIQNYILNRLQLKKHICVVLYGHPTIYCQVALGAVKEAKAKGYDAKVLPGISAEACLFSDLLIDPGSHGSQSYETTDLLIHKRDINNSSHLILWQAGIIGCLTHTQEHDNRHGQTLLLNYLKSYYPVDHKIIAYEASQYPTFSPRIEEFDLEKLIDIKLGRLTTLYIPPFLKKSCDSATLNHLDINISDLR